MMAALSFLFYVASNIPVLGAIFFLLCPVPITFVGVRHGTRRAAMSTACATVLVFILAGGPGPAYLFLAGFGIFGLASGWMLTRQGPPGRALVMATFALTLALAPTTKLLEKGVGVEDSMAETQKMLFTMMDTQAQWMNDPAFTAALPHYKDLWATVFHVPLVLFLVTAFTGLYLNHLVTHRVFLRMGFTVHPPPSPYHMRMPVWGTLALALLWMRYNAIGGANRTMEASLILNGLLIGAYAAWFSGIAAVARMWSPKQEITLPRFGLLTFLGLFFGGIPILVGLFDSFQPAAPAAPEPDVKQAA